MKASHAKINVQKMGSDIDVQSDSNLAHELMSQSIEDGKLGIKKDSLSSGSLDSDQTDKKKNKQSMLDFLHAGLNTKQH